jgi:chromate transporter
MPLMYEQFVIKPTKRKVPEPPYMSKEGFLTGSGMVRAIPGPVFSVAGFHGGMAMSQWGRGWQLLGCISGLFFIFLPSVLLVLFFYPIWNYLKKFPVVYRSLEGINAVVVGIMAASSLYLLKDISIDNLHTQSILNVVIIIGTFCLIQFTKLPSPVIVALCLLLGFIF